LSVFRMMIIKKRKKEQSDKTKKENLGYNVILIFEDFELIVYSVLRNDGAALQSGCTSLALNSAPSFVTIQTR